MVTDALDTELAAEEHRQGRPYLADPEHCERCAEVDRAWAAAVCRHESYVKIHEFGVPYHKCVCNRCGHTWIEEGQ